MQALQTSNAIPVNAADGASRVQPRPVRDALLGLILGVVVGLGAAFLREALDTRIRTPEEIEEQLGLPLLARLPKPDRKLQREDALVMIDDAASGQAEAVRMLRTSLDFARLDRDIRTIVITSAVEQEGKSTTAANLALALASAGHRVALVDGDLRRPYLDRFFEASSGGGLTQVALGRTTLGQALVAVSAGRNLRGNGAGPGANGNGYRSIETGGDLRLLVAGAIPPDAAEFVGSRQVARILAELRESFDTVLIDAPPLLHVGDAMTLGARADAVLLVTRLRLLRRPMLNELRRILESLPAKPLGFVVTGAEAEQGYYGGVYSAYGSTVGTPEKELAR
jgi:Mrp family chromosome partitioning ATPase